MTHSPPDSLLLDLSPLLLARPAIPDPKELRAAVIGTWHGRMVNEWMSSFVFLGLARQLDAVGLRELGQEARNFAGEERRHGVQ